ncbi:MAG TPA: hypothetical protein VIM60_05165 [Edaphobacter sp.]
MLREPIHLGPARALPILLGGYAFIMIHFVLSRALRDTLLGSKLSVDSLPGLTFKGTLLAVALSVVLPLVLQWSKRIHLIRAIYLLNGLIEIAMVVLEHRHPMIYSFYYIGVSASTAIGVSLMWMLIGDWASSTHANKARSIPRIMLFGTAASMVTGFGLVRLLSHATFANTCLALAMTNIGAATLMLFYKDEACKPCRSPIEVVARGTTYLEHRLVRSLALVTIAGAVVSTLLDLLFRVKLAEHFTTMSDRLHFMGMFQGALSFAAAVSQLLVTRVATTKLGVKAIRLHPLCVIAGSAMAAVLPLFAVIASLRIGEYSMRNSFFRFGSEMSYSSLPDKLRVEVRPIIDVVGERTGDAIAAGLLQLLIVFAPGIQTRAALLTLSCCSFVLFGLGVLLGDRTHSVEDAGMSMENLDGTLHGVAREGAILS